MAPTFTSTAIAGLVVVRWIAFKLNDSRHRVAAKSFKIVLRAGAKPRPRTVFVQPPLHPITHLIVSGT
jgi:hypothetical protein